MKKYEIWEETYRGWGDQERGGILILADDIYAAVELAGGSYFKIEGIEVEEIDKLNKLELSEISYTEELQELLEEQGYTCTVTGAEDLPALDTALYFDNQNKEFFDLSDCDSVKCYTWWDGSNHKTEICGEDKTITEVTIDDEVEVIDFDTWDGNNYNTRGQKWYHEKAYKITEIDGEKVDNMYLLEMWSQWQGSHPTALILTKEEVEERLEQKEEELILSE